MPVQERGPILEADVKKGNHTDQFFGHLAETDLTGDDLVLYLSDTIEAASLRYEQQASVVSKSVKGVETLAGSANFEIGRARNLRKLARTIRDLLS